MAFNPLEEKGLPIDRQLRNWSELNVTPYEKEEVEPYSRTRVITLNGAEIESIMFSHQFARHTDDMHLKRKLAETRFIEQQQQKAVNWLIPGNESTLEVTIGYEQVAVDLTAFLARMEPDPYLKKAFEFGLLEDFDHLYRYANLYEMLEGKKADWVTGPLTEITPGRPTVAEHRHPIDNVREPIDRKASDPISMLHVLTLIAAEQQTMNFYMTIGNRPMEPLARGLYLEIAQVEEEHVTHYESLADPGASWLEREVMHQYNECYLYYSFMMQETDPRLKDLWELHLNMELGQLHNAIELLKNYEKREPTEFLPKELPEPVLFESNKDYVRKVLADQLYLTTDENDFVPMDSLSEDHRFFTHQREVNPDGETPSVKVIQDHIGQFGEDYRLETEGEHPVGEFRGRGQVAFPGHVSGPKEHHPTA